MDIVDSFFGDHNDLRQLYDAVLAAMDAIGPFEIAVTKSQIAFRRNKPFAWVWRPEQYLRRKAAPLVLTLSFRHRDPSPRWKQIVEPAPGRFTHHLELYSFEEIDEEVKEWLRSAWEAAG